MYRSASFKCTTKFSKYICSGKKTVWISSDDYGCHVKESSEIFSDDAFKETLINMSSKKYFYCVFCFKISFYDNVNQMCQSTWDHKWKFDKSKYLTNSVKNNF